ncbi:enoyl-[acyl-carrier protein] reductase II [Chromobacterium alkanivorans]|uniref:NAD(P)H-dependent flavin oxidoreductase n=1 Tax=Chromobacterium alkanivorans TaxID=1071719 RepID=UPI002168CB81|nr:nitronate monooxygenase [Chromobacterium alkanivorans]MCS3804037.1 enoyl-[acyl-carrier protein] reductase II [Chromobacterium alkanivorans]MCS3818742.1 enoyl-[acyl-carrier protein] reductase II [Chromobacterium alkanivorans]MCS3876112.1 enoyl-[acyl-carrier protein] reductase II [Chromobacterium alkanivorans]
MQTAITRLLGIQRPLICPGMSYIATPELVAAVGNAGGLGILATGPLTPEQTRQAIRRVRELSDRPFGVGCTLMMPGAKENAAVALEERVPVINFSLGKGDWLIERAHAYGGKVVATVVTEKHARSAQASGADALLVTGHEAAAHGGAVTSLTLIPAIRQASALPIIAAGGFADGQGLIAALALGADAVAMGTRLAMTRESPVHQRTKEMIRQRGVADTLYSKNFDGLWCRVMDSPAARLATRKPLGLLAAAWRASAAARKLGMPIAKVVLGGLLSQPQALRQLAQFGAATKSIRLAIEDGDHDKGVQLIGQAQGLIDDVPGAAELFERILAEADACRQRLAALDH